MGSACSRQDSTVSRPKPAAKSSNKKRFVTVRDNPNASDDGIATINTVASSQTSESSSPVTPRQTRIRRKKNSGVSVVGAESPTSVASLTEGISSSAFSNASAESGYAEVHRNHQADHNIDTAGTTHNASLSQEQGQQQQCSESHPLDKDVPSPLNGNSSGEGFGPVMDSPGVSIMESRADYGSEGCHQQIPAAFAPGFGQLMESQQSSRSGGCIDSTTTDAFGPMLRSPDVSQGNLSTQSRAGGPSSNVECFGTLMVSVVVDTKSISNNDQSCS